MNRDSYGCVAWQPELPDGETVETQESKKNQMQAEYRLASPNEALVAQLMSQTYASQRALINVYSGIMIVKRNWPFLFVAHHMYSHVNTLLGFDVARTFDRCIETVGKQIYRYAHTLVKSQRVKSCLQEIESAKVHTKSAAAEYEAAPLILLAIFNEDKGLLYGVTEVIYLQVRLRLGR
ncbi:hypothetical protein MTO96_051650 [Rhipicephalus appendiculatus]